MALFKTIPVDLSAELGLDMPDLKARITPIVWLPAGVQTRFIGLKELSMDTPEDVDASLTAMGEIVEAVVASWNMPQCFLEPQCPDGCDHSVRLANAKVPDIGKKLPLAMLQFIIEKAGEDDGDIPLPNAPSSLVDSPAQ